MAHYVATIRSAMGDFALIDPYEGFDLYETFEDGNGNTITDENGHVIKWYEHKVEIVVFTFFIYIGSVFFLFMIFMNFIIAVISESYSKVRDFEKAYDYK